MFRPFVASDIIQKNMRLHINAREGYKICIERNGVYGGGVEIIAIIAIDRVSISIYFVSE
jgi:hypothetical protein